MELKKSWKKSYILFGALALSLTAGTLYYFKTQDGIYDYKGSTDKEFVKELFKDNWSWLMISSPEEYSMDYMLDTKSSSKAPKNYGNLSLKVYRVAGKPVGFLAYHKENFYSGRILFVAVDKNYRGRGYAHQLVREGIKNLKAQGFNLIKLNTRLDNKPARKIYESEGFKQVSNDDTYVQYELKV